MIDLAHIEHDLILRKSNIMTRLKLTPVATSSKQ